MCDTCGCSQAEDSVQYTIPGQEHAHQHGNSHDHSHDTDNSECCCHNHEHVHTHSHEHAHPHDHEHTHGDAQQHVHEHTHGHSHDHSHENDNSDCCCHDHKQFHTLSQEKGHTHEHSHGSAQAHSHDHDHSHSKVVQLEQDVLSKNNMLAQRNRGYFEAKSIKAINLVSSPGSGKTTLLEKTISHLKEKLSFYVIEGDQQTLNDANRISSTGAPVIQINTGNGCHLDAEMVHKAVKQINVADQSVLIIENVGNLVCPALFDLGEAHRVVVISVTEGDDKPLKYPTMFSSSDICIINKIDLLPYVDFSVEKAKEYALKVNHKLKFFEVSARTGEGMENWHKWLSEL